MANEPVQNTTIIECPKCKNNVNVANDRCPKCGTILKEQKEAVKAIPKVHPTNCPACNTPVKKTDKFCGACGAPVEDANALVNAKYGTAINKNEYDPSLFSTSEDYMINSIITEELKKYPGYRFKTVPNIEKRKTVLSIILSIIIFAFNAIYAAFHTDIYIMIFFLFIVLLLYIIILDKKKLKMYISEQVKLRPDEKVSYVVSSIMSASKIKFLYSLCRLFIIITGLLISLGIFATPHYIYEKVDGGYNLRYYTFGILKSENVVIVPEKYKNKPVIGIRGDVFKNATSIDEVQLPDTIKEIRGGAFEGCTYLRKIKLPSQLTKISGSTFKDCISLTSIELPSTLTEIGGGAFYNCTSLEEINIPQSVETIGGETFYHCISLKTVKLPPNLKEVRGSTFENCYNLESIVIPEGVTRIGGSAFRQCSSLKSAVIPRTVTEIGSSAFRGTALESVCVPKSAYINERAFKETDADIVYYENECVSEYDNTYGDTYQYGY